MIEFIFQYYYIWFIIWTICYLAPRPKTIGVPDYHTKYYSYYGVIYNSIYIEYITVVSCILSITSIIIALINYTKS